MGWGLGNHLLKRSYGTSSTWPRRGTASLLQAHQLTPEPSCQGRNRSCPGTSPWARSPQRPLLPFPHAEKTGFPRYCPRGGNGCSSGLQLQRAWGDRSVAGLGLRPMGGSQLSFGQDSVTEPIAPQVRVQPRGAHVVSWEKSQLLTACSKVCSPGLSCWPKPSPLGSQLGLCAGWSQLHRPITARPQHEPRGQGQRPLQWPRIPQASSWQSAGSMVLLGQQGGE